jgi:outer membrane protein
VRKRNNGRAGWMKSQKPVTGWRHGGLAPLFASAAFVCMTCHPQGARAEAVNDALAQAYLFSPTLKSARYTLDATNEQRPQALAGWLPTVTVAGSISQNNPTQPSFLGPTSRYNDLSETPTITQPITQGGGEFAKLRAAEHTIKAARATLLSNEQSVLSTAVTAYLDVMTDRAIVNAELKNVAALQEMLNVVQRQVQAGDRTITDQTLATQRVSDAQATLTTSRTSLFQAEARYEESMGVRPPQTLPLPPPLTMLPPRLEDVRTLALTVNPTVLSSIYTALAARDNVDQALASLLPSLSIVASDQRSKYNYPGEFKVANGYYGSSTVELQVTVPLYQGGAEYATVRQAKKNALASAFTRDAAKLDAVSTAEQAWQDRAGATENVKEYERSVSLANKLVEEYQREVAAGEITVFEALDGLQTEITEEVNLHTAERERALAEYTLLAAVGGLTARTLHLNVPYYDSIGDYKRTKWRIWGLGID